MGSYFTLLLEDDDLKAWIFSAQLKSDRKADDAGSDNCHIAMSIIHFQRTFLPVFRTWSQGPGLLTLRQKECAGMGHGESSSIEHNLPDRIYSMSRGCTGFQSFTEKRDWIFGY